MHLQTFTKWKEVSSTYCCFTLQKKTDQQSFLKAIKGVAGVGGGHWCLISRSHFSGFFLLVRSFSVLPIENSTCHSFTRNNLPQIIFTTKKLFYGFKISVLLNYILKYVRCILKILLRNISYIMSLIIISLSE